MALNDLTRISTSGIATGSSLSGAILHGDAHFRGTQVGVTSALFDSSDNALEFSTDVKLKFGNTLSIYKSPTHAIIDHTFQTGSYLRIGAANGIILGSPLSHNETLMRGYVNGASELYHAGAKKFSTDKHGSIVTGILTATSFSGPILGSPINNPSGISTFYDLRVSNNLTVEGTTTTLDTNLIGVDRIEVGADSNTTVGVAITQSGTADILNLYDGSTEVFSVADGGNVTSTGDLIISSALPRITLNDTNHESDFDIKNENGSFRIRDLDNPTDRYRINSSGGTIHEFFGVADFNSHLIVDGNVGIGTDNPQEILHIHENGTGPCDVRISNDEGYGFLRSDSNLLAYNAQLHLFANRDRSEEYMRITNQGRVGIGSITPGQKLDVSGTILTRSNTNTATFSYNTLRFQTSGGAHIDHGTTNQNLNFRVSKSSAADTNMVQINAAAEQTKFRKEIILGLQGGNDTTKIGGGAGIGAYLQLNFANNNIVNTKLMGNNTSWLNSHYGNLGIGTQTADEKFQVRTGTNNFISFTDAQHGSLGTLGSAIIFSRPQDGAKKICGIFQHTNQSLGIGARDDLTIHTGGNAFYYSGSERVRFASNGTVGIGGTTIPGALLDLSAAVPAILFSETGVSANNGKWLNAANGSELYWQAQTDGHSGGGNLFKMTRSNQEISSFEAQQAGVSWFSIRNTDKKVGIGTHSPQETLHVKGAVKFTNVGLHTNFHSTTTIFDVRQSNSDGWSNMTYPTHPLIRWGWMSGPGDHLYLASGGNTPVTTQMAMLISDSHGVKVGRSGWDGGNGTDLSTEYFRITTAGKVGINEDVPQATLHVRDSIPELRLTNTTTPNAFESGRIRFTEYETARMQGAFVHYDGDNNKFKIGVHNIDDNLASNDQNTIIIDRGDGTLYKHLNNTTVQAAFGGTGQVNGITALPSMAGTPFVVGRDTGSNRSAHFGGNLNFDSGYGIDFSATGDPGGMASELLDDYEEGSWTPDPNFATTGSAGETALIDGGIQGQYVKIGRLVYYTFSINFSGRDSSASGNFYISGLPYSVSNTYWNEESGFPSAYYSGLTNSPGVPSTQPSSSGRLYFAVPSSSGNHSGNTYLNHNHIGTGHIRIRGGGVYRTAT